MKKIMSFLMVVLLSVTIFSCKKEEVTPTPTPVPTTKEKLQGKWKITTMTINPALFGSTDMLSTMPDCEKDDITILNSDGTITDDEGATKCTSTNPQTSNGGKWTLSADEKTLTFTDDTKTPALVEVFTIISLSSSSLELTQDLVIGSDTYKVTAKLVKVN